MDKTAASGSSGLKFFGKEAGVLLLALAAGLGLWYILAARTQRAAIRDISNDLATINSYKAAQISAWREAHYRDAVLLSLHPFFGGIVSEEIASPGAKRGQLNNWLNDRLIQKRDASLAFLSPKGAVIAATSGYAAGVEKDFREAFSLAAQKGTPLITDLYLAAGGRPRITMFSPMTAAGRGGKILCVLVINIDPEAEFYPLLKAAPMFYKTAETLLVRKEGGDVLYLNELDYSKGSALKLKHPLSEKNLPAAKALREGQFDFFEGVDYRGVKVFSAAIHVEGTNWAVLTKIDRSAILAPVKRLEYLELALILLAAGLIYGVFYFVLLSRARAAQEIIRESEELHRTILQSAMSGFLLIDIKGRLLEVNETYCRMSGYSARELLAMNLGDLEVAESGAETAGHIEKIIRQGADRFESRHRRKDGSVFEVEASVQYRAVGGGSFVAFLQDITDRKRAEQVLSENAETKSRFASMVSHELRSPLTAISLGISLILEEPGCLSAEHKNLLELAHENTDRLGRLINNVLDFQKMAARKMTYEFLESEISGLVQTTARSMGLLAKEKGLELIVEMSAVIPPIKLDRDKIAQVLTNLLANAIAHTEKGIITVHAGCESGLLHVSVRDTGHGIRSADLPRLFQAFEQLGGGKSRDNAGTGLGLAISKEIILAHNGKIWAESEPGKGSVFHFTLPVKQGGG